MERYVAVDVETTGLDPVSDHLIEIGAVRYENGKQKEKFEEFINPEMKLPKKIIEITNITDSMLTDARKETDVFQDFLKFIGSDVLLGHNLPFDYSFLKTAAKRIHVPFEKKGIDTLPISSFFHKGIPSKSLKSMRMLYGLSDENSHRAYYDALAAAKLFEALKEKFYLGNEQKFQPKPLSYHVKTQEAITEKQKKYLHSLLRAYKTNFQGDINLLSKSEASRFIDKILSEHGRLS